MDQQHIFRIIEAYGFSAKRVFDSQKGYRNQSFPIELTDGQMVNFILYKNEPGILAKIKNANHVADFAMTHGLPTRKTVSPKIMRLQAESVSRYGSLYGYLPGHTIPWESYTKTHVKLLGGTLSTLHTALKDLPHQDKLDDVTDEYLAITHRMVNYFQTPEVNAALQTKLGISLDGALITKMQNLLTACRALEDQQPLHMDFVRSNVLFGETPDGQTTINGILDFEKTARGHRMFDIARTLAFLLVDCKYKPGDKIRKYFLVSGYNKRGTSHIADITIRTKDGQLNLLDSLVDMFLLYDFYKFLRHNPYEYLHQNEHFVRTRDLLVVQNIIHFKEPMGE